VRKAVIDVGSNSVLLLVEENDGEAWKVVRESTCVTALGEGTKETGLLQEPGMTRTLASLKEMFDTAKELQVDSIVAAATMAARIAHNTPDFLARAKAQGTPVMVLSGEDEAELGFQAVAEDPTFAKYHRVSIVDPGGQSTELVTADRTSKGWVTRFRKSYPVGTLGLKGEYLPHESVDPGDILQALAAIDDTIGQTWLPEEGGEVVVLGATGTNLVSIREKLTHWQPERVHGATLEYEEISKSVGWMMPMTDAQRRTIPGMEPGREKTIHVGALILERFLHALSVTYCRVSVRGWRHALLEG
jgi:exopolyphosphatase/guanosine-5'-triphosphate,3'-diphosphate pyrophosphatase